MAVDVADALLSHESALALLDLSDNIPDAVHLLVPRRHRGLRRPPGVVLHTRPDSEEIATVWRDGLPLTAPARTLLDVADRLQPEQFSMAIRQALTSGTAHARSTAGGSHAPPQAARDRSHPLRRDTRDEVHEGRGIPPGARGALEE